MEHVAESWSELIDVLYAESWNPTLQRFRSPFAFRGMSGAERDLSSGLIRLAAGRPDVAKLEVALLRNFRKYAWRQGTGTGSIWHWLALAQHRGLPTRFVDWTYSPFVALHFLSVDPLAYDRDGIVVCVNFVQANQRLPRRLRRILEAEQSDTFTVEMLDEVGGLKAFDALARDPFVVFVEPPSLDARILTQFALFSLMSSPLAQIDDWLQAHPEVVRRVRVPARLKWEVRDKLDQANINERTLLPGLDGLSRWLARYYRLSDAVIQPAAAGADVRPFGERNRVSARPRARAAATRRSRR